MSIFASTGERVVPGRKFRAAVRTFRGIRRDESSLRNSPAKRTIARSAKQIVDETNHSITSREFLTADSGKKQDFGGPVCFPSEQTPVSHLGKTFIGSFFQNENSIRAQ